ncbi:RNA polymerase II-associated protein 3 isoform X2 [Rhinatrema bivittatum]|nr:RNA polymerase II-associated protein 3 isoform X2 [Rhinatrema bivittatum]
MTADPYNPVLPTNRASAFFRLKKFAVAESDCNLAIALNRNYTKAYARRGAARFALSKLEGAKEDYEKVLALDPSNFEAKYELQKIAQALSPSKEGLQDKETEEMDKDPETTDEEKRCLEEQQRKQQAIAEKDLGNGYFKEGKYEAAIECYSRGIAADGTNALLPANRAMSYLKILKFEEAEEDCTQAILLDGSYSKAFARRGTARAALGKLKKAMEDFEIVLKLEPGNKQAMNELTRINKELTEKELWTNQGFLEPPTEEKQILVMPIDKPPHLRSTKPLRRIIIEEVGDKMENIDFSNGSTSFPAANQGNSSRMERQLLTSTRQNPSPDDNLSTCETPSAKLLKIEEIGDTPAFQSQPTVKASLPAEPLSPNMKNHTTMVKQKCVISEIPIAPTNAFQLESDLRKLKGYPDKLYQYLKQIEPSFYSKLFQKSLDPDVFNQILKILQDTYTVRQESPLILEILQRLSELKRFDMVVMFMSESEKKTVHALFDHLETSGYKNSSLEDLKKKYGF